MQNSACCDSEMQKMQTECFQKTDDLHCCFWLKRYSKNGMSWPQAWFDQHTFCYLPTWLVSIQPSTQANTNPTDIGLLM